MAATFKKMIDDNYSVIVDSLPAIQFPENLRISVTEYLQQVQDRLKDQPERYANFKEILLESGARMIENVEEDGGGSAIRLIKGLPDGAAERIKASLEGHEDLFLRICPFLHCKFRVYDEVLAEKPAEEKVADELPGLVEEIEGADKEFVNKWCGFLNKVGGKLSGSGRCKYELLRQLSNFNLGLINLHEFDIVFEDMIGLENPDLMHEFRSLLPTLDPEDKDKDMADQNDSESSHSSDSAKENGRKRQRDEIAEASYIRKPLPECKRSILECNRCHGERRRGREGRTVTLDDEDDFGYVDTVMEQLERARPGTDMAYLELFIWEMYGNQAPEIQSMVEKDPDNAVPIVMRRVLQKLEEFKEYKEHRWQSFLDVVLSDS